MYSLLSSVNLGSIKHVQATSHLMYTEMVKLRRILFQIYVKIFFINDDKFTL